MPCNGPTQEVPETLLPKNPLHAAGSASRRRVWPVGAVSKTMWS